MSVSEEILIVAGEASGDLHASRLIRELQALRPELRFYGLGSDEMRKEGCELLSDSREIAVVGITEVFKILPRAWQVFRQLQEEAAIRRTRTAILLDFPDFNLRLAKKLKRQGLRVVYYISPQVWAWRRGRIRSIRRTIDRMLVLFPFEVDFYRSHGVEVVHVGHPLLDEVPPLPQAWDRPLPAIGKGEPFTISLLPGSRGSEVRSILPWMLASVAGLAETLPVRPRLIQAPSVDPALVDEILEAWPELEIERVHHDRFAAIADSHLAFCASGTATLEVGLLGTPMLVLYQLSRWSYLLARWLVELPHFAMVNLVLGQRAVPEILPPEPDATLVVEEATRLLTDPAAIDSMREALAELRPRLGERGASRRAAEEVVRFLDEEKAA